MIHLISVVISQHHDDKPKERCQAPYLREPLSKGFWGHLVCEETLPRNFRWIEFYLIQPWVTALIKCCHLLIYDWEICALIRGVYLENGISLVHPEEAIV